MLQEEKTHGGEEPEDSEISKCDALIPQHCVIIIVTFWQQALIKQTPAEPFNNLQLLNISYVFYGDYMVATLRSTLPS